MRVGRRCWCWWFGIWGGIWWGWRDMELD